MTPWERVARLLALQGHCMPRDVASLCAVDRGSRADLAGFVPRRYARQCVECARRHVRLTRGHCGVCRRVAFPELSATDLRLRGCPEGLLRVAAWHRRPCGRKGYDLVALRERILASREAIVHRIKSERKYRGPRCSMARGLAFVAFVAEKDVAALRSVWAGCII